MPDGFWTCTNPHRPAEAANSYKDKSEKVDTDVPKDGRGLLRSEDCIEARQISGDFDVYKICCSADMVAAKNCVQRALRLFLRDQGNLRDEA